jgi:L-amino acid N-acyltransferase YncA
MLRLAEIKDAGQISAIYRPYVEKTAITFEETPPGIEEMESKIAKVGPVFPFLVYEEAGADASSGQLLGYAYATRYRERAAYRWSLEDSVYVREDSVGRGIGKLLLAALVEILRESGYVKIYAVITPPNPPSVRLHEQLGFLPLCRFEDTAYKLGAWQAIDWMELTLREPSSLPAGIAPAEPLTFAEFARSRPERLRAILAAGSAAGP